MNLSLEAISQSVGLGPLSPSNSSSPSVNLHKLAVVGVADPSLSVHLDNLKNLDRSLQDIKFKLHDTIQSVISFSNRMNAFSDTYDDIYKIASPDQCCKTAQRQFKDVVNLHNQIPTKMSDVFNKLVVGYVDDWRAKIKPVEEIIDNCNKLKKDYDHYDAKVRALDDDISKRKTKGKDVTQKEMEKIMRNKQKLLDVTKPYQESRNLALEACRKIWDDRFIGFDALMLRMMQFFTQYTSESFKVASKLEDTVGLLKTDLGGRDPVTGRKSSVTSPTNESIGPPEPPKKDESMHRNSIAQPLEINTNKGPPPPLAPRLDSASNTPPSLPRRVEPTTTTKTIIEPAKTSTFEPTWDNSFGSSSVNPSKSTPFNSTAPSSDVWGSSFASTAPSSNEWGNSFSNTNNASSTTDWSNSTSWNNNGSTSKPITPSITPSVDNKESLSWGSSFASTSPASNSWGSSFPPPVTSSSSTDWASSFPSSTSPSWNNNAPASSFNPPTSTSWNNTPSPSNNNSNAWGGGGVSTNTFSENAWGPPITTTNKSPSKPMTKPALDPNNPFDGFF